MYAIVANMRKSVTHLYSTFHGACFWGIYLQPAAMLIITEKGFFYF